MRPLALTDGEADASAWAGPEHAGELAAFHVVANPQPFLRRRYGVHNLDIRVALYRSCRDRLPHDLGGQPIGLAPPAPEISEGALGHRRPPSRRRMSQPSYHQASLR